MSLELGKEVVAGAFDKNDSLGRVPLDPRRTVREEGILSQISKTYQDRCLYWERQLLPYLVIKICLITWFENALCRRALQSQGPCATLYKSNQVQLGTPGSIMQVLECICN